MTTHGGTPRTGRMSSGPGAPDHLSDLRALTRAVVEVDALLQSAIAGLKDVTTTTTTSITHEDQELQQQQHQQQQQTEIVTPSSLSRQPGHAASNDEGDSSTAPGLADPAASLSPVFHLFTLLPAELRLQIWRHALAPRTIELHTRRTHYADDDRHGGVPKWQSRSRNPALLSACSEAREVARAFYTARLPLAQPVVAERQPAPGLSYWQREWQRERPGDLVIAPDRVLYIAPAFDTVVVLGDFSYSRMTTLLAWFRTKDASPAPGSSLPGECVRDGEDDGRRGGAAGGQEGGEGTGTTTTTSSTANSNSRRGLRRLALSASSWSHERGAVMLRMYARTLFRDLDELVLFLFAERAPPIEWAGGTVAMVPCEGDREGDEGPRGDDYYRRFFVGNGRQFREGDDWMKVGERPLRVMDLEFQDGW